jgi:hypothetical protein
MLPYANRLPLEEGVPMRLLFKRRLRAGRRRRRLALVARASQPPPRPEVRFDGSIGRD